MARRIESSEAAKTGRAFTGGQSPPNLLKVGFHPLTPKATPLLRYTHRACRVRRTIQLCVDRVVCRARPVLALTRKENADLYTRTPESYSMFRHTPSFGI